MTPRIVHLTTVHPRKDVRIAIKEVASLTRQWPGEVELVVADGKGAETGIQDIGPLAGGRFSRLVRGNLRAFCYLRRLRPTILHFHDPELIPVALVLKLIIGPTVIYDAHENISKQILGKHYIPRSLRPAVSWAVGGFERLGISVFDAAVAATPGIASQFPERKAVTVQNFPIADELATISPEPYSARPLSVAFVGNLSLIRGAIEMVDAMARMKDARARLEMAGRIVPLSLLERLRARPGWQAVNYHGEIVRPEVKQLLAKSRVGLVLFHASPNHLDAYPNKMFEYMAAGLPVIASDFPLWRSIVENAECGRVVDPLDVQGIADSIQWLLDHPAESEEMGQNGRRAIHSMFNWTSEEGKLIALYEKLDSLNRSGA